MVVNRLHQRSDRVEPICLIVRGKLKEQPGKTYLHRGIANEAFERHFELADYIEVTDATMGEGLLVVDLEREVPEALKPKSILINNFVPGPAHASTSVSSSNDRPRGSLYACHERALYVLTVCFPLGLRLQMSNTAPIASGLTRIDLSVLYREAFEIIPNSKRTLIQVKVVAIQRVHKNFQFDDK
jgi:hypothetical protein